MFVVQPQHLRPPNQQDVRKLLSSPQHSDQGCNFQCGITFPPIFFLHITRLWSLMYFCCLGMDFYSCMTGSLPLLDAGRTALLPCRDLESPSLHTNLTSAHSRRDDKSKDSIGFREVRPWRTNDSKIQTLPPMVFQKAVFLAPPPQRMMPPYQEDARKLLSSPQGLWQNHCITRLWPFIWLCCIGMTFFSRAAIT